MLKWLKAMALFGVAATVFAAAPAAKADTVVYGVQGHFATSAAGATVVSQGAGETNNVVTYTGGTSGLGFFSQVFTDTAFDPTLGLNVVSFGQFVSVNPGSSFVIPTPLTFSLDIYQNFPGAGPFGPGTFVGSVTGSIVSGTNQGNLIITFNDPLELTLPVGGTTYPPAVIYTIPLKQQFINIATGNITGALSAVPLPATASLGLSLIAGLGCVMVFGKLRRAKVAA